MIPTVDRLNNFIQQMSHFDPDNMQMGAKAVCQLVLSGRLNLQQDKNTANKIRQAFIKQMQSDNYNVHAHAIRCIADMVPKLPSQQVQIIFQKIIKSIADKDLDQKKRQIYGICAGTVIHQAAQQYGQKLSELFVQSVNQLMKSKDQKNEIQVILINVTCEFIRKWPRISANSKGKFDCNQLVIYLLKNIQIKSKLQILKKSQTALGKVALILTKNHLEVLFQNKDYGILYFLASNCGKMNSENMKKMRNGLLCLANVLKTHNGQIKYWADKIAKLLIQCINQYKNNDNIDQIDLTCDILDSSIICLSYLLKSYSRQLQIYMKDPLQPLNNFVEELINFDMEGQMSYISLQNQNMGQAQYDAGEQGYDDYYEAQGENDEKGWKVRRATMHYLIVLLKKNKIFKDKVSTSPDFINSLSAKLIQANPMVSQMAFQTFNSLIEAISTQKNINTEDQIQQMNLMRVKSNQKSLAKTMIDEINKRINVILQSSKFSDQLKIEANRIIFRMVQIFKEDFNQNTQLVDSLLKTLSKQLKNTQIIQNKNYSLLSIKELISSNRQFKYFEQILKQTIKLLNAKNLKLIASAYKCIRTFIRIFPTQIFNSQYFNQILVILKLKLKQHDADRIVKYSVVKCLGPFFSNFISNLKAQDQKQIISSLNAKLQIQIQKSYILEQLNKIPDNYCVNKQNINLYKNTLELVAANLGSSNAQLNFQVVETTTKLIKIIGDNIDAKLVEYILLKAKPIFSQYKVPQFLQILINKFPNAIKSYSQSIVKSTQSKYIELLIKNKIITQFQCINILKSIQRQQSAKNISLILSRIFINQKELKSQINQSKWGLICLGSLGYIGSCNDGQYLMESILNHKNQQFKLQAASALGNITSRNQVSLVAQITVLAEKSKDYYIFIYAIKQYLNFKIKNTLILTGTDHKLTDWLFKKSQNSFQGESIYHLIAQCIGKIAYISTSQFASIIKYGISQNQNHRFVVANSLRFYFEGRNKNVIEDEIFNDYLKRIIQLIGDKSVNIRASATKSFNSLASSHFSLLKPFLNQQFWFVFKNNLHFDQSLIIQVDYGISKEKKDLGRPLRIQSFNFLKFIIKNCNLDSHLVDDLMLISLANINKQSNPDLLIKRLSILRILCQIDFTQFISHISLFIQKIGIEQGILKPYQSTTIIDQRNQIYLKSILKELLLVNKLAQKENIDQIRGYITTLKSIPRFGPIFEMQDLITAEHQDQSAIKND